MRNSINTITLVYILVIFVSLAINDLHAQQNVGIGTESPDASAKLDISSTDSGILIPRMTMAQRDAINLPATGLMVYVTDNNAFYFYNGAAWNKIGSGAAFLEDTDGDTKIQVEEGMDDDTIRFDMGGKEHFRMSNGRLEVLNTGGSLFIGDGAGANDDLSDNNNVFIGDSTGASITFGRLNVALGAKAFMKNTTGANNVAIGHSALLNNSTGEQNVAIGQASLKNNTNGSQNVASGYQTLFTNTTGRFNVANGYQALYSNTTGLENTANGYRALYLNTSGNKNVASGTGALLSNSTGDANVATGYHALYSNITGLQNTANGYQALENHEQGGYNVAIGSNAMQSDTTGSWNTAIGAKALFNNRNAEFNTAVGSCAIESNTEGNFNTGIGRRSLNKNTVGEYNSSLGYDALYNNVAGSSNVAFGTQAGYNSLGDSSIYIGNQAGYFETSSNRLYIENSDADSTDAFIYGQFDNDILSLNASVGIDTLSPSEKLHVSGGNLLLDRKDEAEEVTRTIHLNGARLGSSSPYAAVEFSNFDVDNGGVDYLGASIKSFNLATDDSGDLQFFTKKPEEDVQQRMIITPIGRVGIGTSTPSVKFHVGDGDITLDRGINTSSIGRVLQIGGARNANSSPFASINFQNIDDNNGNVDYIGASIKSFNATTDDSGDLQFYTTASGDEAQMNMILSPLGRLGIGVNMPDVKLHVGGGDGKYDRGISTNTTRALTIGGARDGNANPYAKIDFENFDVTEGIDNYNGASIRSNNASGDNSGNLSFWTANSNEAVQNRMSISENGNVGINIVNPDELLHVYGGDIRIDRGGNTNSITRTLTLGGAQTSGFNPFANLDFQNLDGNGGIGDYVGARIQSTNADATNSGDLAFWTSKNGSLSKHMVINEDGDTGIGEINPNTKLNVKDTRPAAYLSSFQNNGPNGNGLIIKCGAMPNPDEIFINFQDVNGGSVGNITGTGGGGIIYGVVSDRRYKSNIHHFYDGLKLVMKLKPVRYEMKSYPGKEEIGFLAQDLYEQFPQAVSGTPENPIEKPMTVDYSRITPLLVGAVQDQQKQIDALQSEQHKQAQVIKKQQEEIDELKNLVKSLISANQ